MTMTAKLYTLIDSLNNNLEFMLYREQQDCHDLLKVVMQHVDTALKTLSFNLETLNPRTLKDDPKSTKEQVI